METRPEGRVNIRVRAADLHGTVSFNGDASRRTREYPHRHHSAAQPHASMETRPEGRVNSRPDADSARSLLASMETRPEGRVNNIWFRGIEVTLT